ncbi:peptidylprolyl isomerase [Henriciella pelagia]|jgi:peptidylprolyl isomerase|uniref:peptidylprolyl isomerase n=1 Tax=Henriciella pelagia TaxID=1977912 RepID=A0ABQ1JGN5_9PROT|nr:peptidylprolyl isomerase [Henriciella pelagia]GGB65836.1 peptidyl-prolyl cis-trans isomerase [Henriciella pelagia]
MTKFFRLGAALGIAMLTGLASPSQMVAQEDGAVEVLPEWRPVLPENLLLIETEHGTITIELNPDFAPGHVERIRKLAFGGIMNGNRFYRVIDGFVAQGGFQDETAILDWPNLTHENDRPYSSGRFTPLGNKDLFAPEVGHIAGFPVGRSELVGREWLLHCPGAMAMARDTDPNSGSTEFYIVLDAQRYLDRNLTIFGRVIDGMEHVQALQRGSRDIENGVIQPPAEGDEIISFRIAADMPEETRPKWEVMVTGSKAFEEFKRSKRVRSEEFFFLKPPEVLDICSFSAPVRRVGEN